MENKPLSCPFCGSTKILTDIRHQIASFPTPKAIIRINWCTCYECGASSSLDAWQKRATSERHQRLVEAAKEFLRVICSNTIQNNESIRAINALKAVLEGEKGAQETSCQATHE